ncbi:uncharacterized protein LOC122870616 [Siniperca chuatsi]|uniref:uncharacterized protein LOC122870616 n=1 Tax=Siniperca chuatsi TaxID=119488 RepID=UPI001CE1CF73|nr:uncharacterized protein LOC122870616 [Siniperca chuatsi]
MHTGRPREPGTTSPSWPASMRIRCCSSRMVINPTWIQSWQIYLVRNPQNRPAPPPPIPYLTHPLVTSGRITADLAHLRARINYARNTGKGRRNTTKARLQRHLQLSTNKISGCRPSSGQKRQRAAVGRRHQHSSHFSPRRRVPLGAAPATSLSIAAPSACSDPSCASHSHWLPAPSSIPSPASLPAIFTVSWDTLTALGSSFSDRLLHLWCLKERYHRSFLCHQLQHNICQLTLQATGGTNQVSAELLTLQGEQRSDQFPPTCTIGKLHSEDCI